MGRVAIWVVSLCVRAWGHARQGQPMGEGCGVWERGAGTCERASAGGVGARSVAKTQA